MQSCATTSIGRRPLDESRGGAARTTTRAGGMPMPAPGLFGGDKLSPRSTRNRVLKCTIHGKRPASTRHPWKALRGSGYVAHQRKDFLIRGRPVVSWPGPERAATAASSSPTGTTTGECHKPRQTHPTADYKVTYGNRGQSESTGFGKSMRLARLHFTKRLVCPPCAPAPAGSAAPAGRLSGRLETPRLPVGFQKRRR